MTGFDIIRESLSASVLKWMKIRGLNQDDLAANTKFCPADICKVIGKKKTSPSNQLTNWPGALIALQKLFLFQNNPC